MARFEAAVREARHSIRLLLLLGHRQRGRIDALDETRGDGIGELHHFDEPLPHAFPVAVLFFILLVVTQQLLEDGMRHARYQGGVSAFGGETAALLGGGDGPSRAASPPPAFDPPPVELLLLHESDEWEMQLGVDEVDC